MTGKRSSQRPVRPTPSRFRQKLLDWYARSGRHGLPWRGPSSPYRIMVSEFMLQQTTVAAVIPYYRRFLEEFPTAESLARAKLNRVLELWSGLGYYARARNLHAAAQKLVRDFKGKMPKTPEEVRSLPGVGRYTAGAILSLAFNKPEPLVDGNVIRVLSRVYGIRDNVKKPEVAGFFWDLARKLVPPSGARRFNSALMDFGATVCRPSSPNCPVCPFFLNCWARRHGRQETIPRTGSETARKRVDRLVALVRSRDRWLLVRRPETGLYGGLWEFPGETMGRSRDGEAAWGTLQKRLGISLDIKARFPSMKHVLSHREIQLYPVVSEYRADGRTFKFNDAEKRWASADEINNMAVSTLTRRLLAVLNQFLKNGKNSSDRRLAPIRA